MIPKKFRLNIDKKISKSSKIVTYFRKNYSKKRPNFKNLYHSFLIRFAIII